VISFDELVLFSFYLVVVTDKEETAFLFYYVFY